MVSGGFDLNMLVLDFPRNDRCSDADWWPTVNAFEAALKTNKARGRDRRLDAENLPEEHAVELLRRGIVPIHGIAEAFDAAEAAAFIGEAWADARRRPVEQRVAESVGGRSTERGTRSLVPRERVSWRGRPPHKGEVKTAARRSRSQGAAAAAGLPVPRAALRPDEAVAAATALGFPVALKALGIAHKSEHGAVRLNLHDEAAVRDAANALSGLAPGSMSSAWCRAASPN